MTIIPFGNFSAPKSFPTVVSTNSGGANASNTLVTWAMPLPPSIVAGNLLLIHGGTVQGDGAKTVTTPSGWTPLFNVVGQSGIRRMWCFYKTATGSEGATVNISASGASFWNGVSYQIDNYQGTPVVDAGIVNATTSTPNPPSVSITWGEASGSLIITMVADDGISSTSAVIAPTDYTDLISGRNVNGAQIWGRSTSARRFVVASSEDPGTFTHPGSGATSARTIAIRGA